MSALQTSASESFEKELMDLMLCRELKHFVEHENEYIGEPDEYLEEFYETTCDPSFNNSTSDWAASNTLSQSVEYTNG